MPLSKDETEFCSAVQSNNIADAKRALETHPPGLVNTCNKVGIPPLCTAVLHKNRAMVDLLLKYNAAVNLPDRENGCTPFYFASCGGDTALADLLLKRGATIDAANRHGITPLHAAVCNSQLEMVAYLLNQGAEVNTQTTDGRTPLSDAKSLVNTLSASLEHTSKYVEIVDLLNQAINADKVEAAAEAQTRNNNSYIKLT